MSHTKHVAIIGGGPAGLMAAEVLSKHGVRVTIYDRMPSLGRKFLMAGRGGLNLTHSDPPELFLARYGAARNQLAPVLEKFSPLMLRNWCEGLGQKTFIGSSGRVFPEGLKASPLLRAWFHRLKHNGVIFAPRHTWMGWNDQNQLIFHVPQKEPCLINPNAVLLALGGASWPRLGSNGAWAKILTQHDITITPLSPANCGFVTPWSAFFAERFAGQPLKSIKLSLDENSVKGEAMITSQGLEGGALYALSSHIRTTIAKNGPTTITLDLRPDLSLHDLEAKLEASSRGSQSLSNYLRKSLGLSAPSIGLVHEALHNGVSTPQNSKQIAHLIKSVPVVLTAPAGIERAISTAGGIALDELDEHFMLKKMPGVFAAGEMLDWEAPTGGYLLQASFSTGYVAALGILTWLAVPPRAENN